MSTVRAEIELTTEDWDQLAALLDHLARSGIEGVGWLLGEGVRRFIADHDAWEHLVAAGRTEDDPAARELQRREAEAHLVLMRVRAADLEARMDTLRATVADLNPQYQKLKSRLFTLQHERRELTAAPDLEAMASGSDAGGSLGTRVWRWLVGRRG